MPRLLHSSFVITAMLPTDYIPRTADDLIGPAHKTARVLLSKLERDKTRPDARYKHLLYGPPGTGKSALADLLAATASGEKLDDVRKGKAIAVDRYSGLDVTIDRVREWEAENAYRSLFGDWKVKLVNELDRMPPAAQDRLLEYLDKLPPRHAFIGTSNLQIGDLQTRFSSRLAAWKILGPDQEEIAGLIRRRWPQCAHLATQIALASGGCVRAALMDTESTLDVQMAA